MLYIDASTYDNLLANALSLSTTQSADINDSMDDPVHASFKSPIKTFVHIYRGGFCGRGNTTASYSELNRYVSNRKKTCFYNNSYIHCIYFFCWLDNKAGCFYYSCTF